MVKQLNRCGWALALLGAVATVPAFTGCGDSGKASSDSADADAGGTGGTQAAAALTEVYIHGAATALKIGDTFDLMAMAKFDDGTETAVTGDAEWTSSDPAVLSVEAGKIVALAEGSADITAKYQGQTGKETYTISAAVLTGIAISPQLDEIKRDSTEQLTVTATFDNGTTLDVTDSVTWESSNADVASIDEHGLVTGLRGGPVRFTASYNGQSADLNATGTCDYPRFARQLNYGAIMPPLYWDAAYKPDGSTFDFKLEDVYCDVSYKDTKVLFIIVSAGWCTPCTLYAQRLRPDAPIIAAAGGLIAIMESQDDNYGEANNAYAQRHINHIIGDTYAIRLGDQDTKPISDWLHMQPLIVAFPTVIAVRTRDMAVITDSNRSQYYLPLLQIAQDPEADWSNPGIPPFNSHCGPTDDEASEATNDDANTPTEIGAGTYPGGICDENPDFYKVTIDGNWKAELDFDANVADLDMYAWDPVANQPIQENGNIIGSSGSTGHEEFAYHGAQVLSVMGYQGASAAYTLKITAQ